MYVWASFGFICYINTIMKTLYHEPRPFWVSQDIKPEKCRAEFGNPSGHAMITSFFWVTVYLHYYFEVGQKKQFNSIFCTAYIIKMAITASLVIFLMFMALSRVYLGEHSYNQVFYGTQLGLFFAFSLHYLVKPVLKKLPKKLRNSQHSSNNRNVFEIKWSLIILTIIAFLVIPLAIAFGLWNYSLSLNIDTTAWDQRIKIFCGDEPYFETNAKFNKLYIVSGTIGLTLGSLLG